MNAKYSLIISYITFGRLEDVATMLKKGLPIWHYFAATTEDPRIVNCKVCGEQVFRGSTPLTWSTF